MKLIFFQIQKRKKNPVQGRKIIAFLVGALAQSCGKISEMDPGFFTATKICTPDCYTRKILSAVRNSRNVWKIKIKGMDVIWALDAI